VSPEKLPHSHRVGSGIVIALGVLAARRARRMSAISLQYAAQRAASHREDEQEGQRGTWRVMLIALAVVGAILLILRSAYSASNENSPAYDTILPAGPGSDYFTRFVAP
jgi:anti-sigma-K factor RskA